MRYLIAMLIGGVLAGAGVVIGMQLSGDDDGSKTVTVNAVSRCGMTAAHDALAATTEAKGALVRSVACPSTKNPSRMLVVASGGERGRAQTIHLFQRADEGWKHADSTSTFAQLESLDAAEDNEHGFVERGGVTLWDDPECCPTGRYRRALSIEGQQIQTNDTLASNMLSDHEQEGLAALGAKTESDLFSTVDVTRDGLADALFPAEADGNGTWRIAARPSGERDGKWKVIGAIEVENGAVIRSAQQLESVSDLFVVPECAERCVIDKSTKVYHWNGESLREREPSEAELSANACDTAAGQYGWIAQARRVSCGDAVREVETRHPDSLTPPPFAAEDDFECYLVATHYESTSYACYDEKGKGGYLYSVGV